MAGGDGMKREEIFKYVKEKHQTDPDYTFKDFPNYAALKHEHTNKWYGLVMDVEAEKLGFKNTHEKYDVLNVKVPAELLGSFREGRNYLLPAYHMNKEHWLTILLNEVENEKEVFELLDQSYELTRK